jgi:ABC-type uncharacterized transport system ATPase subunit
MFSSPQGDFPARKMIDAMPGVDEARKQRLMAVLDVDPEWRMHQVSDGQRRRVQICVGLLRPFKVCTVVLLHGSWHWGRLLTAGLVVW